MRAFMNKNSKFIPAISSSIIYRFFQLSFLNFILTMFLVPQLNAGQEDIVFGLFDSKGQTVIESGLAKGRDILEFDYSVAQGAQAGVAIQGFPAQLGPGTAKGVRAGVRSAGTAQARQVSVNITLKGTLGSQTIPIELKEGWSYVRDVMDWNLIGSLTDVVFLVTPRGGVESTGGAFSFSLEFDVYRTKTAAARHPGCDRSH
jgi:hypothetical protein